MTRTQFQDLDHLRTVLQKVAENTDNSKAAAGIAALTVLADAMLKMVDEIEELKRNSELSR
jgi:hypothetical protein